MDLLNAMQVAVLIDTTVPTLNSWYKWKKLNPKHPMAKLLPKYITRGNRNTRYWKRSDVYRLIEFKASIPHGRNGILGAVTQQYVKKNMEG